MVIEGMNGDRYSAIIHKSEWIIWGVGIGWSPFWAAAPKGLMTYAFTQGKFLLLLLLLLHTPPPRFRPRDPTPSLKAQIPASRPKSQPQGPNPSLEAPIPTLRLKSQSRGSNLSQEAQIPASKLKSQLQGPDSSLQAQIKTA